MCGYCLYDSLHDYYNYKLGYDHEFRYREVNGGWLKDERVFEG